MELKPGVSFVTRDVITGKELSFNMSDFVFVRWADKGYKKAH